MNSSDALAIVDKNTGMQFAGIALIILPLIVGFALGFLKRRKDEGELFSLKPFAISLVVSIFFLIGYLNSSEDPELAEARQVLASDASSVEVEVKRTPGFAGVVFPGMSPKEMRAFEKVMRERTEKNFSSQGISTAGLQIRSENLNFEKSIVTKIEVSTDLGLYAIQVIGMVDGSRVDIGCSTGAPKTFRFEGNDCFRKVVSIFGPKRGNIETPERKTRDQ